MKNVDVIDIVKESLKSNTWEIFQYVVDYNRLGGFILMVKL